MRLTPLPDSFFSELLPTVDDLNELKVTLHIMWRLAHKHGYPRYVSRGEILNDATLRQGFQALGFSPEGSIRDGLERALARGTLLAATAKQSGSEEALYFLNSEKGRQALDQLRNGELSLPGAVVVPEPVMEGEQPNIFALYEQNIGLLKPMLVEELKDAERTYPLEWIEDAFREAVFQNKRSWRYIERILERWAAEGRGDLRGRRDDRRRYVEGKYAEYYKRGPEE